MTGGNTKPGWVYVLTNEAMPGLVKIGMTGRNPLDRAAELGGASGVPASFVVAWSSAVSDCAAVESAVHRMLSSKRMRVRREFFAVDVKTARQVIEAAAGAALGRAGPVSARRRSITHRSTGGPRAGRRFSYANLARRRLSPLGRIGMGLLVALVLLVVLKPPVPAWLPPPLAAAMVQLERLSPVWRRNAR